MNTSEVIESYVYEVAVQLPRKQRNDVAFELRALIDEGLQDKAEAVGRAADAAMAIEFLRAFGRPEEVAARYRPALTIIDPADGHAFVRAVVVGLGVIWGAGLLAHLRQPFASASEFLSALGQWWASTVVLSMWWPGALVASFSLASWTRRRWPQASEWKPRTGERSHANRAAMAMAVVGIVFGLFVLLDPRWVLDFFFGGRAAPAAYEALTYAVAFRHRQGPVLLVLLMLNVPLLIAVIVSGRWSAVLRRMDTGLGLATCAVMAWTVLDGPVFMAQASDQMTKLFMLLIIAGMLFYYGIRLHRSVRPTPNQSMHALR